MSGTSESVKKGWTLKKREQARQRMSGARNPNWKGGKYLSLEGYVMVNINGKHIYEHRKVMQDFLKRELSSDEHIHHINGIKTDNKLENLMIVTNSEHKKLELKINGHPMQGKKMSKSAIEKSRLFHLGTKASFKTKKRMSISAKQVWERRKNECLSN